MNDPNNLSNVSISEEIPSLKYMFCHNLWNLCVLWLLCSFDYEGSNELDYIHGFFGQLDCSFHFFCCFTSWSKASVNYYLT
jgi:hypothetical protein